MGNKNGSEASRQKQQQKQPLLTNPSLEFKVILQKFSKDELSVLKSLFYDLSSRSPDLTVDKQTFLQFFPLPGMWGERLFEKFDRYKTACIDFEEFMTGLSIWTKGTEDEKIRFLFSLYDLKRNGQIEKSELKTMLHNTLQETVPEHVFQEINEPVSIVVDQPIIPIKEDISSSAPQYTKSSTLVVSNDPQHRRASLQNLAVNVSRKPTHHRTPSKEINSPTKISELAEEMFENADLESTGSLCLEDFKAWLKDHPKVFETFDKVFPKDLWHLDKHRSGPPTPTIRKPVKNKRRASCGCLGSKVEQDYDPAPLLSEFNSDAGYVYIRQGRKLELFFLTLNKNMLYIFEDELSYLPNEVIFIEGCYIDILNDFQRTNKHGLRLSHVSETFKEVYLYCDNDIARDSWANTLRASAKARVLEDHYTIQEQLGVGKFSKVYKCIDKYSFEKLAVKVCEKTVLNLQEKEMLRAELAIMKLLNHPNVIQLREIFDTKTHLYIIMELIDGGELFKYIQTKKQVPEAVSCHIVRQLVSIIDYLHEVGIIHRDIKPENILITEDINGYPTIKLIDFGLSRLLGPNDKCTIPCGTLGYVAPEVLTTDGYSFQVDVWSIGVVLYLMLRGLLPFESKDNKELVRLTLSAKIYLKDIYWDKISLEAKDMVNKLLDPNPKTRITTEEILKHPWTNNPSNEVIESVHSSESNFNVVRGNTFTYNRQAMSGIITQIQLNGKVMAIDATNEIIFSNPNLSHEVSRTKDRGKLLINQI